eukprot:TRINITY_DN612_c0_g1_i1.p1 TRINITY_DN612_c0_g1~~TRINITY_DN612_c0_g1_i1.p1  ORF type:complete len:322 (-),score=38.62 TRINITY_DN612_c0_g1_i1:16-981(-)
MNTTCNPDTTCSGHGTCLDTPLTDNLLCHCNSFYLPETNCSMNFFHVYEDQWIAFFVPLSLGILSFGLVCMTIMYLVQDFIRKNLRWAFFIRIILLLSLISQILFYGCFFLYLFDHDIEKYTPMNEIFFQMSLGFAISALLLTNVIWIGVLLNVKKLSMGNSRVLRVMVPVVISYGCILTFVNVTFAVLQYAMEDYPDILQTIDVVIISIGGVMACFLSFYGGIIIQGMKRLGKVPGFLVQKKPFLFGSGSVLLLTLITQFVYAITGSRKIPGPYLAFTMIFELIKILLVFLNLLTLDRGVLMKHTTSVSTSSQKRKIAEM